MRYTIRGRLNFWKHVEKYNINVDTTSLDRRLTGFPESKRALNIGHSVNRCVFVCNSVQLSINTFLNSIVFPVRFSRASPSPDTTRSVSNFISDFVYRIVVCLRESGFRRLDTRPRTIWPIFTCFWRFLATWCSRQPRGEPKLSRRHCDFKWKFARSFHFV